MKMPAVHESVLSMAVREAVTNVVRHAQARTCAYVWSNKMDPAVWKLRMTAAAASTRKATDLRGMRERVEMLGGTLQRDTEVRHKNHDHLPLRKLRARKSKVRYQLNPVAKENRKTIRVVLAEDQGMVLGALAALLEIEGDISVVAQARNGKEALDAVLAHKPDVLITDIEMPLMTGLDAAAELKRRRVNSTASSSSPRSRAPDIYVAPWKRGASDIC